MVVCLIMTEKFVECTSLTAVLLPFKQDFKTMLRTVIEFKSPLHNFKLIIPSISKSSETKFTQQTQRRSPIVFSMLAHRLRRWVNIEKTMGEPLVFAG